MSDNKINNINRLLSVAPMMDWTDRHCRYLHRLLAPSAWLYTEMVTSGAILHGDRDRLLQFNSTEHPVALQLGGSDPEDLAECARIGADYGYDEINLNLGCPSDRVQKGRFGACLMLEPDLVHKCLAAMCAAVDIPVTAKCRLGVDDHYSYGYFRDFVGRITESGVRTVIVHARKAWLSGLSPRQNREIPALEYDWVYRLKMELPDTELVINGGVDCVTAFKKHLEHIDGVMLGRAAYQNPWILAECQAEIAPGQMPRSREAVIGEYSDYMSLQIGQGVPAKHMTRHALGVFQGRPGARHWRRYLSQNAHLDNDNVNVLKEALAAVNVVRTRVA